MLSQTGLNYSPAAIDNMEWLTKEDTCYVFVKPKTFQQLHSYFRMGMVVFAGERVWSLKLTASECKYLVFLVSVRQSKHVQAIGLLTNPIRVVGSIMTEEYAVCSVEWKAITSISFTYFADMKNPLHKNICFKESQDGHELSPEIGYSICQAMLALPSRDPFQKPPNSRFSRKNWLNEQQTTNFDIVIELLEEAYKKEMERANQKAVLYEFDPNVPASKDQVCLPEHCLDFINSKPDCVRIAPSERVVSPRTLASSAVRQMTHCNYHSGSLSKRDKVYSLWAPTTSENGKTMSPSDSVASCPAPRSREEQGIVELPKIWNSERPLQELPAPTASCHLNDFSFSPDANQVSDDELILSEEQSLAVSPGTKFENFCGHMDTVHEPFQNNPQHKESWRFLSEMDYPSCRNNADRKYKLPSFSNYQGQSCSTSLSNSHISPSFPLML